MILDACVLIAFGKASDPFHQQATNILRQATIEGEPLLIAKLTMAEVLTAPAAAGRAAAAQAGLIASGIRLTGIGTALDLAAARATTTPRLKMPDCVVLRAAEVTGQRLATFDDRLRQAAQARGVTVIP